MEDNNKANIVFNISGGNNQILPNAIKAEQNFYGDKYIEIGRASCRERV